jgi:glycosyltransferase involved in cell wall biosynthesis
MRIAFASTFPPYRGGIAQFNEQLSLALREMGHDVQCTNWKRQYPEILFPGKAQLSAGTNLDMGPPAMLDSIDPRTWKKTARFLSSAEPEVLLIPFWHAALTPALTGVVSRMKKKQPNLLVIGLMHNATSHDSRPWDIALTKRFVHSLDFSWTLSDQVASRLSELTPGISSDVFFHPLYDQYPALPPQMKARETLAIPSPQEVNVILFFGLIRSYKGLRTLITSMDKLAGRPKPVHLIIAGEVYGDWKPYQELINERVSPHEIHVHNRFIPDDELPVYFSACDAVCLPYLKASQSGVTAIALHYGKPVVASNVGGLSEYLQEPGTGELCEPDNPLSLAISVERVLDNLPANPRAFDAARERYSWSKLAQEMTVRLSELTAV